MATPEGFNLNLLPPADGYYDSEIYETILLVAKNEDVAVLKQQLATHRRKRTNAYNAIKDLRQRMAGEEDPADLEGDSQTLLSLTQQWEDMNLAVKSLEDLEEHREHLLVLGTPLPRPSRLGTTGAATVGEATEPLPRPPLPPGRTSVTVSVGEVEGSRATDPFLTPMSEARQGSGTARSATKPSEKKRQGSSQVSKVDLPELVDKFSLQHHLTICEALMVEAELGDYAHGLFEPYPHLRFSVVNRILTSLKGVGDVHSLAVSTAEQQNHGWAPIRQVLLSTFAKRETLLMELRGMVGALKYSTIDKFCADARKVYAMIVRLFGADNKYEIRGFVESLVARLPSTRASALISEIHNTARLQSYTPDWPLVLPFDGADASVLGVLNRLERQEVAARALTGRGVCATAEVAVAFSSTKATKAGSTTPNAGAPGATVRDWCARYPSDSLIKVFDLWGEALRQKIPDMIDNFAMRGRKRKFPLFRIVALPQGCDREVLIDKLKDAGVRAEVFAPFT